MNKVDHHGNFVVFFKNDENSMNFFKQIPPNVYVNKDEKRRMLRVISTEPDGPKLSYQILVPRAVLKVVVGSNEHCDISLTHIEKVADTAGDVLWK